MNRPEKLQEILDSYDNGQNVQAKELIRVYGIKRYILDLCDHQTLDSAQSIYYIKKIMS